MIDKDSLQRFLFENAPVRGEIVHLDASYQTIMQQHRYPTIIRQLLGECLVVASLLSAIVKFKGRLTVQFQGKGRLKLLLAQCNQQFHLRGLAQWNGDIEPTELLALENQVLLHRLYSEEDVRLFAKNPINFQCNCSIERGENAVLLLGLEEVEQEIKDKQYISVICEFCSKEFLFDRVDIAKIFKKGDNPLGTNLH